MVPQQYHTSQDDSFSPGKNVFMKFAVDALDVSTIQSQRLFRRIRVSFRSYTPDRTILQHHRCVLCRRRLVSSSRTTEDSLLPCSPFVTELFAKKNDGVEESPNLGGNSDGIDEIEPTDRNHLAGDRHKFNPLSDFLYGANYVNSHYLSIVWKYSIVRSFALTLPIGIALWIDQSYGIYDSLFRILRSGLAISSAAARLLQLPLEFTQSLVLQIWNISPEAMATAIDFLPSAVAITVVRLALSVRTVVTALIDIGSGNTAIRFLSSMIAILLWRPAVEEWQYRSVLDKLLFGVPRGALARWRKLSGTATVMTNEDEADDGTEQSLPKTSDSTSAPSLQEVPSPDVEFATINRADDDDTYAPFLPDESTRILLGSLLFATTRLGWLAADPADTIALSNSPYGFTIGFIQSILSLFSSGQAMPEVRHGLRLFLLLLAIHQTVSTFMVAQHVFAGVYRRRGLAASVGAHVSWTVGKGTIFFRLLWKFWKWSTDGIWSSSWGNSVTVEEATVDSDGEKFH